MKTAKDVNFTIIVFMGSSDVDMCSASGIYVLLSDVPVQCVLVEKLERLP